MAQCAPPANLAISDLSSIFCPTVAVHVLKREVLKTACSGTQNRRLPYGKIEALMRITRNMPLVLTLYE